jgi:2-oxoglutarate dehydrogenase E2 component (dihydrolipoamide succinyltransferase)
MKTIPILMPQMGQSAAEGTIVKWRKQVGENVAADDIVVEVESDKIAFEVEPPSPGRLASCLKAEGEIAAVGEIIGQIEISDEACPQAAAPKPHAGANQEQVLVAAADNDLDRSALPDISKDWLSPYVVRMAMLNSVSLQELRSIRGSGRQGRVTKTDLLTFLARRTTSSPPVAANPSVNETLPREAASMGQVIPMTNIRRTIADHMVQSIHTSAHVTMVHAVDMTHIVALRERIKDEFEKRFRVKMTYTTVVLFVTSRVLRQFPNINASVYGSNLLLRKDVSIGCAVALQDESLVVPVVRDADQKTFPQIAQDLDRLIKLARTKSLTRADIEGGTFTISNFGAFGSLIGTPIINQPQVAILGMGAVFKAPVVIDGQITIRDQLYLSFTFDHRVIDGAMGGRFLNAIQKATESLDETMLDVAAL